MRDHRGLMLEKRTGNWRFFLINQSGSGAVAVSRFLDICERCARAHLCKITSGNQSSAGEYRKLKGSTFISINVSFLWRFFRCVCTYGRYVHWLFMCLWNISIICTVKFIRTRIFTRVRYFNDTLTFGIYAEIDLWSNHCLN